MAFFDFLKPLMIKAPELTYFDHLVGEFDSLEASLAAAPADSAPRVLLSEAAKRVEPLRAKRQEGTVDWNDLYLFEMLLADLRPDGALRSKVLSLRRDYRSVAGQVEYDEYLASKPKNLLDPPDPRDPPDEGANYALLLRDDLKDLLGRLFKRYAILPVREARLKRLTIYASLFCVALLIILIAAILTMAPKKTGADGRRGGDNPDPARQITGGVNANTSPNDNRAAAAPTPAPEGREQGGRWDWWPSIPLFVVLASGAMGGFVSALQRVQSSPTEGDSVYNLSMLYHGSYAVFVAPLTGAIFSILLYMMFTGNILQGSFFPDIYTPAAQTTSAQVNQPRTPPRDNRPADNVNANAANINGATANNRTNNARNTNNANANAANSNAGNSNGAGTTNSNVGGTGADRDGVTAAGTETATAAPTPQQMPTASLSVKDFLYDSGPAGGKDYALLIIWCFIAGFAERFVPDSLNRLISRG